MSPTVTPLSGPTKRTLELLAHIVELLPDNTHTHTHVCLLSEWIDEQEKVRVTRWINEAGLRATV